MKCPSLHILFCLIILLFVQNTKAQEIVLKDKAVERLTANTWSYLADPSPADHIDQLITKYEGGLFRKMNSAVLNAGIAKHGYWLHFRLRNETGVGGNFAIEIENSRLNHLALYEVSEAGRTALGEVGDWKPFNNRAIRYKNFVYHTHLDRGESKSYFLFVRQTGNSLIVPVQVYKGDIFWSSRLENYIFDGVTYGILLFVTLPSCNFSSALYDAGSIPNSSRARWMILNTLIKLVKK